MHITVNPDIHPKVVWHNYYENRTSFYNNVRNFPQWSVMLIEEGSFCYRFEDCEGTAGSNDVVLLPPDIETFSKILTVMSFHFFLVEWEDNLRLPVKVKKGIPVGRIALSDISRLHSDLKYLDILGKRRDEVSGRWREILLNDLWNMLCWELNEYDNKGIPISRDHEINAIARYISENANSKIRLKDVACKYGLSPMQLTRRFHTSFNMMPGEYILNLKMKKACELLAGTDLLLSEIATLCGYEDQYYLSRIFNKKMGVNPSGYRKRNKIII